MNGLLVLSLFLLGIGLFTILIDFANGVDFEGLVRTFLIITLPLLIISIVLAIVWADRTDIKDYKNFDIKETILKEEKATVSKNIEEIIDGLPKDTLKLYESIGSKNNLITNYPDIAFTDLMKKQFDNEVKLQKEIETTRILKAELLNEMENRRLYFPAKYILDKDLNKLLNIK